MIEKIHSSALNSCRSTSDTLKLCSTWDASWRFRARFSRGPARLVPLLCQAGMDHLASSAKYLAEKGLTVWSMRGGHLACAREGEPTLDLFEEGNGYCLRCWEFVPGPGEDDFNMPIATLDEALLLVWGFYFAEAIEIAGWILPIHRRPFWPLAKVQYRLANAVRVTLAQFEAIQEERSRRAFQQQPAATGTGLDFAETTQFICAGIHRHSGDRLFFRRDLEQAYSVAQA